MYITKKSISRREALRGLGVTMSLPLLESMVPALTPLRDTPANTPPRFAALEMVHGSAGSTGDGTDKHYWSPEKVGRDFETTPILRALAPYRDHITIVSHTDIAPATAMSPKEAGADHTRSSAAWLTCAHARMTEGADIHNGISMDQLYAQRFGQDTPLPSMQVCIEDVGSLTGACGYGYSCVYANTISWSSASTPLPMERDPRVVFEQLFGDGATPEERLRRRRTKGSILDGILEKITSLGKGLGPSDRARLSDYFEDVREIERRIERAEQNSGVQPGDVGTASNLPEAPVGVPDSWVEHVKLMFDLQLLAFQTDVTRVSAFKMSRDVSSRVFTESDVKTPFHILSHHQDKPEKLAEFARLNEFHVNQVAYFIDRLANTPDGDGSLLDHSVVLYGSPMGDGSVHNHLRVPLFIAGHGGGSILGNNHVLCADGTPMANVLLTLLNKMGVEQDGFGDSTGVVDI